MRKRYTILLPMASAVILLLSCSTNKRIKEAYMKEGIINIRQPNNREKQTDTTSFVPSIAKVKDKDGKVKNVAQTEKDKNGEDIASFSLGEIEVVAKSKIVPERDGMITIGFIVTVPSTYSQKDWRIIVSPTLDNDGNKIKMAPVAITGKTFEAIELREQLLQAKRLKRQISLEKGISERDKGFYPFFYKEDKRVQDKEEQYETWAKGLNRSWVLDTMIQKDVAISYFYKQDFPTEEMRKNVKLYVNSEMESLDNKKYTLERGDTLTYVISSMTQFMDRQTRYIRETVLRKATEDVSSFIYFPAGKTEVIDTLFHSQNKKEIDKVSLKMKEINESNIFVIDSVGIVANCSPEGDWRMNERLAKERADALQKYMEPILSTNQEAINLVKARNAGENWQGLEKLLEESDLVNADAIIQVIRETKDPDRREDKIATLFPTEYRTIREDYYPKLRSVDFTFYLSRRGMVEDALYTNVVDTAYAEAIRLMDERKYKEAMPKLLEYRDMNTAICYMSLGYNGTAVNILLEQPVTAEREYLLAILYARLRMTDAAIHMFKHSIKMDPSKLERGELDPEIARLIKENDLQKELY